MAKNEATQAFRGRYSALARKSSLELSEAMNFPDDECVKKVSITGRNFIIDYRDHTFVDCTTPFHFRF